MNVIVEDTRNSLELARLNKTVQVWHHENCPDEFKAFDINKIEKAFRKMLENENVFAYIAKHQEKPIGYLLGYIKIQPESAFQYEKRVFCIDQIAVMEEYQKEGVGQLLMNRAYELAKSQKVKEILLDFWVGNQRAERFFLRNGFNYLNHKMKK